MKWKWKKKIFWGERKTNQKTTLGLKGPTVIHTQGVK